MKDVIVILGPTASGKTAVSIELAKTINGEIISADSMQVYKHMNIGTAKPTDDEMQGIQHYLINEVDPCEEFSVVKYQQLALTYIEEILNKEKTPIIAGGTGLYINSVVDNIDFSETVSDWSLREQLNKEAEEKGNDYLYEKLKSVDPIAAKSIHKNNVKRVIRALEVYEQTKTPFSEHKKNSRNKPPIYNFKIFGLTMDREKLYKRIDERVDKMFELGLINEVEHLIKMGYGDCKIAMQGIGYKEILKYLKKDITLDEAIYIIKRDTRHYAKRQLTWFRRVENINWIDVDKFENIKNIVKNIKNNIAT